MKVTIDPGTHRRLKVKAAESKRFIGELTNTLLESGLNRMEAGEEFPEPIVETSGRSVSHSGADEGKEDA